MLKREMGAESNLKLPHLFNPWSNCILGRFLSLRWETCLRQNCTLGSCACSEEPALGQNTLMLIHQKEKSLIHERIAYFPIERTLKTGLLISYHSEGIFCIHMQAYKSNTHFSNIFFYKNTEIELKSKL